ncbi:torsin-1A-like isoform X1 [Triplophysa rosa]|uniref:torsin-1A-like isoform X1 n=1 Tax=Triplophysa rosa TaxID=992332 RepID=UPI002545C761|nr:torsin-1A-like isoform X1 [Triplophysa rosa]
MKAAYLVIVLLLSDITLTSGDDPNYILLGGSGVVLGVIMLAVFQRLEMLLPFDPKRLHRDLNQNLYGQHIVSDVVLNAVSSFICRNKPTKQLALSFHGTTGVGKNHVAKIIARNIYQKGEHSKHYITFISGHHFPLKDQVDMYSEQLKKQIGYQISSFPLTMFVFDEMDKMNPQLAEAIKPFLNFVPYVNEVSYHRAIFIFLSNAGGNVITSTAVDFLSAGKSREEIQMNSKGMDAQIHQSIFSYESSGFWQLVDHFVPFLPLERKHVRQCVLAEMASLKISVHHHPDLADKVVREMPFFPPEEKFFSIKGCKSVRQKLMLHINEMNIIE